ncbi:TPA: DUF2778 domain-containing protein [Enterobacter sichuanensis]|nr:DUF2778 domain-containing protein [Enterobacter sichuanensis]HEM8742569.1 DUF2778 domain-containing protein [Enterobacter sichuanensis]
MQICMMDYGSLSADGKTAYLKCYGIGTFEVLSGIGRYINNPDCADHEKAAIPPGTYWVTDRPAGSLYNRVRAEAIDAWHGYRNHHSEWFALFSDKTKKDSLNVNGLNRTGFRLHPLNSDGTGESWGCITLRRYSDFQHLRRLLLQRGMFPVPGGNGLRAYARIDVCGTPDFSLCDKETEERKDAEKRRMQHALKKRAENAG